ncbi:OLC1v1009154C1 [Oldenlandia corymbosa var. corymbosa]|uniref:OLC1v1009154C1 n=1 Tax=Oldenlandia corymbosa var. corymbosa TaxID=529605 RepID=A0AAV1DRK0_OLDCO|nr:OLC1v1009154C1 [Oldenlandia corymbosa var. corymbosa]
MEDTPRHTCLKLELPQDDSGTHESEPLFVKGTWFPSRFDLAITDGCDAWTCNASEEEVDERASQWDQPVTEYIDLAEKYLGFQQPGSVYGFSDAGNGHKRLSWTFEKEGIKLEWRWKCQPALNMKKTTADIMDFLMDANIRLSEEVVRKTETCDRLRVEAEKCLAQSEKLSVEKAEFEDEIYAKFLVVLNSKKSKLRELRDRLSNQKAAGELPEEEEGESTDKTESYDERSDDGNKSEEEAGTSKDIPASKSRPVPATSSRGRGRKRK